jgi:GPH family glycoside/pentoside/hexuronide:cation symporter
VPEEEKDEEQNVGAWGEGEPVGRDYKPIPLFEKIAYGVGVLPQNTSINSIKKLSGPIFNITLGMHPFRVGNVLMAARLWDAFTDPVMGWLSDNTKSRWGRRRPYLLLGAILTAIAYALILDVPKGLSQNSLYAYFLLGSLGLYTCVTILQVSYNSLGFELSHDYHERTNIFAYRSFFQQISNIVLGYLFYLCTLDYFADTMEGAKYVGMGLGLVIFLFMLPTVFFTREGHAAEAEKQEKIPIIWAIKTTLKTKPFLILCGLTFVTIFGGNFNLAMGPYVNIYHVAQGDVKFGAEIQGHATMIGVLTAFVAIPLLTWLASRIGKVRTLGIAIGSLLVGSILKWFCYTPAMPYLQLVVQPFLRIGEMGFWLIITSMKADICDWDEWKTGFRREGMYGAATGWFQKVAQATTFALGQGYILAIIGFDATLGANQDPEVMFWMRFLFSALPATLAIGGLILLRSYEIDEEKAMEIKADLDKRHLEAGDN